MRTYCEYDVVVFNGETIEGVMRKLLTGVDADWTLLNASGPGGGNPNVLVIGTRPEIDKFEAAYNAPVPA